MKKNTTKNILAVSLLCAASATHAGGFYVGADVAQTIFPDYTNDWANGLVALGATSASATQTLPALGFDIHAGQWVSPQFGWEIGYNDFGSSDGSFSSNIVGGTGTYKYSATAADAAVLGAIPLGRGKLFGKAGLYSASTKGQWAAAPLPGGSQTQSSTGLMLGGGYEFFFTEKLSGRAGINLFNGVKFWNAFSGVVENKNLVQLAVGVNFGF